MFHRAFAGPQAKEEVELQQGTGTGSSTTSAEEQAEDLEPTSLNATEPPVLEARV